MNTVNMQMTMPAEMPESSRGTDILRGICCAACAALSTTVSLPFGNLGVAAGSASAVLILCMKLLHAPDRKSWKTRIIAALCAFIPMLLLSGFIDTAVYQRFSEKGGGPDLIADISLLIIIYIPAAVIMLLLAIRISASDVRKLEMPDGALTEEEFSVQSRKYAVNAGIGVLGCAVLAAASYSVENFTTLLFLPLLLICGILLPVFSRIQKKHSIAKPFVWILRMTVLAAFSFIICSAALIMCRCEQDEKLYAFRRFAYLRGTVFMSESENLLPKALPAVHDDYFFYTKPYPHPMDDEFSRQGFLFLHTDDAGIAEIENKLMLRGETVQSNLNCSEAELAEMRADYADTSEAPWYCFQNYTQKFPTQIYRVLRERGILQEDISHADYYPHALINKETGLVIIWACSSDA